VRGAARLVAGLAAGLLVTSCTGPAEPADGRVLDLVVSPHPDDELEAWSLIGQDENTFTVFLTMTHGEATVNCDPAEVARNTQSDWGELAPEPSPQGPGTPSCAQARIASWNAFLDSAAALDPDLPALADLTERDVELAGHPAQLWSSDRGVRIAVDGGDGELTVEQVQETVEQVLALDEVPDLPLQRVVGAAYTNDPPDRGDAAYALYRHPDHWAVRDALLGLTAHDGVEARDGICVTTWPSDPAASQTHEVDATTYDAFMGLGPEVVPGDPESVRRVGSFQRVYGWLAFPRSYWTPTDLPIPDDAGQPLVMSRTQTFTCS
jgi:LmbE family N-acetylglucosaminyl deacetylase